MNIIGHCISDRRSLIAVAKLLRKSGHTEVTMPYYIYHKLHMSWPFNHPLMPHFGGPNVWWTDKKTARTPFSDEIRSVSIRLWPEEIDDACEAFDRSKQLSPAP